MACCFKMEEKHQVNHEFMENGRKLLEELITTCDGRCNIPLRTFSYKDIWQATNNFDRSRIVSFEPDFTLYQGFMEGRPVSIKTYKNVPARWRFGASPFTDIAIGAQMSVHKNVLKLIGCCLKFEHPILVHEFTSNHKLLNDYISKPQDSQLPSWKFRIKIALDIANAVAYLHSTVLSRPVIHRDLTLRNIVIVVDQSSYLAKLTNFSYCLSIPDGETHLKLDTVTGTSYFLAPEYASDGYLTEKSDVYAYGVLLFCILTGRQPGKFFRDKDESHSLSSLFWILLILLCCKKELRRGSCEILQNYHKDVLVLMQKTDQL
ncbi:hypothetical protein Tsubulata_045773 [Turnera subulata]|uniref:Protein kinase domain-containing protein n=1 Tax=Turnera subulata TaxID=218843 RepID=A0A9Q0IZ73_9ROSI|nr:hypothetical protein Tsubulata_045773 [Turnera subulata]